MRHRLQIASPLASRDETAGKDSLMTNFYAEKTPLGVAAVKRPGYTLYQSLGAGCGQGLVGVDGTLYAVNGDVLTVGNVPVATGVHRYSTFSTAITQGGSWAYVAPNFVQTTLTNIGSGNERTDIKTYDNTGALLSTTSYTGINGDRTNGTACGKPVNNYPGLKVAFGGGGIVYGYWGQNGSYTLPPGADPTVNALIFPSWFSGTGYYLVGVQGANGVPYGSWPDLNKLMYAYGRVFFYMTYYNGTTFQPAIVWFVPGTLTYAGYLLESSTTTNSSGQDWVSPTISLGEDGYIYTYHAENSGWGKILRRYSWNGTTLTLLNTWDLTALATSLSSPASFTVKLGVACIGGRCVKLNNDNTASVLGDVPVAATALPGIFLASAGAPVLPIAGTSRYLVYDGLIEFDTTIGLRQTLPTSGTLGPNGNGTCLPVDFQLGSRATSPLYLFFKTQSKAFVFNITTQTYSQVTDPDYPATTVRGTVCLDGTFYVMTPEGKIYGSALYDPTTWTALNYVTAAAEPDAAKCLARQLNYLVAFKEFSTEFFYNAGNAAPGSPLGNVLNSFLELGCASGDSVATTDNTIFWMSQARQKGRSVYMLEGYTPKKVSNEWVDRLLDADDLVKVRALCLKHRGHYWYFLTLADSGFTLVFDSITGEWHRWTSKVALSATSLASASYSSTTGLVTITYASAQPILDGDLLVVAGWSQTQYNGTFNVTFVDNQTYTYTPTSAPSVTPATGSGTAQRFIETFFQGAFYASNNGQNFFLDDATGGVYQLNATDTTDNGTHIDARSRGLVFDGGEVRQKLNATLEIVGDKSPSNLLVRYSDDDYRTYSKFRSTSLNLTRSRQLRLGTFRRRAFEFRHTDADAVRLLAAEIEFEPGAH